MTRYIITSLEMKRKKYRTKLLYLYDCDEEQNEASFNIAEFRIILLLT